MKKQANRKKLNLPKETVRALRAFEMAGVAGGWYSSDTSCFPAPCNIDSDPCP